MSKKIGFIYSLFLIAAPLTATAATVLRTVALLGSYDAEVGYFASPVLPTVTWGLLLGITVALVILSYELRELFVPLLDYRDLPTLFSGVFLSISLAFFAVLSLISATGIDRAAAGTATMAMVLLILASVAAAAGAAPFILRAFRGEAASTPVAMLMLPLAALGLLVALYFYFEPTAKMNEPNKILAETVWILAGFFFLGEARIALGRAKWPLHTCVTAITVIFSATAALPNLIYHAVKGASLHGSTMHDFVLLGIFLYALSRLIAAYATAARSATPEMRYATDFADAATASLHTKVALDNSDKTPEEFEEDIDDEEASDR